MSTEYTIDRDNGLPLAFEGDYLGSEFEKKRQTEYLRDGFIWRKWYDYDVSHDLALYRSIYDKYVIKHSVTGSRLLTDVGLFESNKTKTNIRSTHAHVFDDGYSLITYIYDSCSNDWKSYSKSLADDLLAKATSRSLTRQLTRHGQIYSLSKAYEELQSKINLVKEEVKRNQPVLRIDSAREELERLKPPTEKRFWELDCEELEEKLKGMSLEEIRIWAKTIPELQEKVFMQEPFMPTDKFDFITFIMDAHFTCKYE